MLQISQEFLKSIVHYKPETGEFVRLKSPRTDAIGRRADYLFNKRDGKHRYRVLKIGSTRYHAHHLAWLYMTGETVQKGLFIDHIDGDGTNNSWSNLRVASQSQNNANTKRYKSNKSGYKGVWFSKQCQKWRATIQVNKITYHVGSFNTPEEAYAAYCLKASELFGDFANGG